MIESDVEDEIKKFLEKWIDEKINEIKSKTLGLKPTDFRPILKYSKEGRVKPFTGSFLVDGILRMNEFERTLSGGMGTSFEECAKLIAEQEFSVVKRGSVVKGSISKNAIDEIEKMVNEVTTKGRPKNYLEWVEKIVSLNLKDSIEERERISDLYLQDKKGNEIFIEIKSPKPNKGQCVEVLDRHLHIHAIKKGLKPKIRTFFAMAYNPWGNQRTDYKWSFSRKYLDMENHVLLGSEFWDFVGGPGTNEEIIRIYKEVGNEKGPKIFDELSS